MPDEALIARLTEIAAKAGYTSLEECAKTNGLTVSELIAEFSGTEAFLARESISAGEGAMEDFLATFEHACESCTPPENGRG